MRPNIEYKKGDEIAPCRGSAQYLEAYAAKVAKAADFSPGDALDDVVARFGGRLIYRTMDEWILQDGGAIYVHGPRDFDIAIARFTSPTRDRFTIAHELGHYFLHSRQGEIPLIVGRLGDSPIEREANRFAAALLMPEAEFRAACADLGGNLDLVAARFNVSRDAAKARHASLRC